MLKIITRFCLLALITLGLSLCIGAFVYKPLDRLPWSYVSDQMHLKAKYYSLNQKKYNTLFIGSSVVRRGFNPDVFDAKTESAYKTHSFNFGVNWMGAPETIYLVDKLALNNNDNLKYVFIELSKLKVIDYANMHTARAIYWYDWKNYLYTLHAVAGSPSAILIKGSAYATHTISYFEKLLNIGYVSELNDFHKRDEMVTDSIRVLGDSFNGFKGLEGDLKLDNEVNGEENVQAGLRKFLSDTSGLTARKMSSAKAFDFFEQHPEATMKFNKPYLDWVNLVTQRLMSKGIYPIFVISPKADKRQYDELLPVFFNIDPLHRINIADSRKYPELYQVAYAGDETHLNKKGAEYYSTVLATEFNRIMGKAKAVELLK